MVLHAFDLTVLALYLAGVVGVGWHLGRQTRDLRDYFLSGRRTPGWAILASIVATETSTVTFLSVPAFAFAANARGEGGNWTFLSLALGSVCGRVCVAWLLLPRYFRGELFTVYQALQQRFDVRVQRAASALFLATRCLADGIRLMATALILTALTRWSDPVAILILAGATILYTWLGGMKAVIWTDVLQACVYLAGAGAAAWVLLERIPGGWETALEVARSHDKLRVFDFGWDVSRSYTFWAGLVGGVFLTTATHGTDQLMVQRYLSARNRREAAAALLGSGLAILMQFALFLGLGTLLFVYYREAGVALPESVAARPDRVFPHFVVTELPAGVRGLVIAAVFAAAMSTLSSSLNSLATAALTDFCHSPASGRAGSGPAVSAARRWTLGWGLVQAGVALATARMETRIVDMALALASFTSGPVLGLFFLALGPRRVDSTSALIGLVVGMAVMVLVGTGGGVSWQWYTLTGSVVTWLAGCGVALWRGGAGRAGSGCSE